LPTCASVGKFWVRSASLNNINVKEQPGRLFHLFSCVLAAWREVICPVKDHGLNSSDYPPEVWQRAQAVRLLLLDVDGVLTDGSLWFDAKGEALKVFHVLDGHGIKMAQRGGIEVALLSGRRSDAAYHRAKELGISRFYEGLRDKVAIMEELLASLNLIPEQAAMVGDDLVDLPVMVRVGLAVAVADAVPQVAAAAHWVTSLPGGRGAVRQVCDLLLQAQGKWDQIVSPWLEAGD
jgi:3-deoxy-D-manno-octulosonate 8-phosphate phosphatase (KDO 8-P phosphatase)